MSYPFQICAMALLLGLVACGGPDIPLSADTQWHLTQKKSPMDDSQEVIASAESDDYVKGRLQITHPKLNVQCSEHQLSVWFNPELSAQPEYGTNRFTLRIRFDQDAATKISASQATDQQSLNLGGAAFIQKLGKAKRLAVGFTPFSSNPATASFDLVGLHSFLPALRQACPDQAPHKH